MKDLTDLGELTLGSRLKKISDQLFTDVDAIYQRHGIYLSSRCFPILFLLKDNGDLGITQLADLLGQAHSSVSQMSKKLLTEGYIENKPDPNDERRRLLGLTADGIVLFEQMHDIWDDIRQSVKDMLQETDSDFMFILQKFEQLQLENSLEKRVIARENLRESERVEIIPFEPRYRDYFKKLNVEWLEKYFYVEEIDNQVLSNPETYILEKGGFIFFARYKGEIIGTSALIKADDDTYELTKMSVTEKYQGLKVGRKLAIRAIEEYEKSGATTLFLESNSRLKPALKLYEKLGFEHKPRRTDSHYQRSDVHMVYQPQ